MPGITMAKDKPLFAVDFAELERRVLAHMADTDAGPVAGEFERFRSQFYVEGSVTVWLPRTPVRQGNYSSSYPYLSLARALGASYGEVLLVADVLDSADPGETMKSVVARTGLRQELIELVATRWLLEQKRRAIALSDQEAARA